MFTATRPLCRGMPSFWRRSVDEFKRQAGIAIRMEAIKSPEKAFPLIQFTEPNMIDHCKLLCDSYDGGFSRADLTYREGAKRLEKEDRKGLIGNAGDDANAEPSHAEFKGSISTELPPNRPDIQRSGYAAWRTYDRGFSLFGKLLWDLSPFRWLAFRIKSDGRKYFVNIQTESIVPTDLHQHLLPCYTPGKWETVAIPIEAFVRTNYGMVVEPQKEMMTHKVRSIGIGLTDRVPGPYEICIADIYATNNPPVQKMMPDESGFDEFSEDADGLFNNLEKKKTKDEEPEKIMI